MALQYRPSITQRSHFVHVPSLRSTVMRLYVVIVMTEMTSKVLTTKIDIFPKM